MATYPTIEELLAPHGKQVENDTVLLKVRRSLRSIIAGGLLFILTLAIVILLNYKLANANLLYYVWPSVFVSIRWLSIIPALIFLELVRKYNNDLYTFTLHTLTRYSGRLSLNFSVPNIRFIDIRAVIVHQSIWGRIFGYGDVELDTAAQEKTELYIEAIADPESLSNLIEAFRQYSLSLASPDDPNSTPSSMMHE